jgi:hypothetical protein
MGVALLPIIRMYFIPDLRRMFDLYTAPPSEGLPFSALQGNGLALGLRVLSKRGVIRVPANDDFLLGKKN